MRRFSIFVLAAVLLWPAARVATAQIDVGLSLDNEGIRSFHLAIGEHYQVPEKEIIVIREKNVPDEELPVVFFLARKGGVAPATVIKLRLGGKSWMEITRHFGLTAEIFYVPVTGDPGPPYGKAYGHFKKHKRADWGSILLNDVEIVNFVNLKFICERYSCPADDVIKLRSKGGDFMSIHGEVKKNRGQANKQSKKVAAQEKTDKPKGKGKKK